MCQILKLSYYRLAYTVSIATKFCTTIHVKTTKYSLLVIQISTKQIQYGGRLLEWKSKKNRDISKTVWSISLKFGTLVHLGLHDPAGQKVRTLKIQDDVRPSFWEVKKITISVHSKPNGFWAYEPTRHAAQTAIAMWRAFTADRSHTLCT